MFRLKGVIAEKFLKGELLRMQSVFDMPLNTEAGVIRFLEEQRPFKEITITDIETKEDKTDYFLNKLEK